MASQDQDRNEPATPYKLEQARRDGHVARSQEMAGALVFGVAVMGLAWSGTTLWLRLFATWQPAFAALAPGQAPWTGPRLGADLFVGTARVLVPGLLVLALAAVLGHALQGGLVFSAKPLVPDGQRLHPATQWRRLMSMRAATDALRVLLKLVVLALIGWQACRIWRPAMATIAALPPAAQLAAGVQHLGQLALLAAAAFGLLAVLDMLWTRRSFARDMRMSRRELVEEHKQREGDPRIRRRLRELRRELLQRSRSLQAARTADVVLVNPTHVAVALRYVQGESPAPVVVSKGAGALALAIRTIANRHGVVVVPSPALARRLLREAPLDQPIPVEFHPEVARLYVWLLALRAGQRPAGGLAA